MPVKVTPEQFTAKHAQNLKASVEYIRQGIARVSVAPTSQAADKRDKMLSRLTESVTSGKWERGLRKVSLEDWKKQTAEKGIGRIAGGIDGAKAKVTDFATQLLPHIERGQSSISSLPDMTLEDSITRMTTFVRHMAKFERK